MKSFTATIFALLFTFITSCLAQGTSTSALLGPSAAPSSAKPGPNTNGYSYVGCWNETTGYANAGNVRALAHGVMMASNNLTTGSCLDYCANQTFQYCGMEYGRECWASSDLNAFSTKLSDANCTYACQGNSSEVCGGSLTISLYNLTGKATSTISNTKKGAAAAQVLSNAMPKLLAALPGLIIAMTAFW